VSEATPASSASVALTIGARVALEQDHLQAVLQLRALHGREFDVGRVAQRRQHLAVEVDFTAASLANGRTVIV
jgi:hypothetical protein